MTGLELVLTLLAVLIFVLISMAIIYVQWWRRKFRQEHSDDVGSVAGHSTHSTSSKEMMYFMCWENSSQVAAVGLPMSPAGTNKGRPPAFVGVDKHPPPAFAGADKHPPPAFVGVDKQPPPAFVGVDRYPPPAFVGVDRHPPPAFVGVDRHPPPAFVGVDRHPPPAFVGVDRHPPPAFLGVDRHPPPASPPSPPVLPMKPPFQARMDLPRKPQAATRDADHKLVPIPQGYNVLDKVYPNDNVAFFTNKEVLDDGERRRSSATGIAAGNVFRQPSAELVFATPAQSPPFYTPLSSPLRTIAGQVSNLHTSSSLPSSTDVVERLYSKKVVFKDTHHVKIMVGQ